MEKLNQFLFLKPFLKMISEGSFFKTVFVWFLRILAILTILGLLGISYKIWALLSFGFQVKLLLLIIIMQIIVIVLCYLIITILLTRAEDIENMPRSNDYLVLPIFVIVAKMAGEILDQSKPAHARSRFRMSRLKSAKPSCSANRSRRSRLSRMPRSPRNGFCSTGTGR